MARYTFGDDEPAVVRLSLVAAAYEPVTRAFLQHHLPDRAAVVVDAGCGPGFSTELIARVRRPEVLIGLDSSAPFLEVARARLPGVPFVAHDVTTVPFPTPPPAAIYARLVLAHLGDPGAVLERWRSVLAPGGCVLSEELEDIEAPSGPLREYDELSSAMVRRGGGVMCAGPLLAHLGGRCLPVRTTASEAARIYAYNVRLWRTRTDAPAAGVELDRLEQALSALAAAHDKRTMAWIVRQSVVRSDDQHAERVRR